MGKQNSKMKQVRIYPEVRKALVDYKRLHPASASIPVLINYAAQCWLNKQAEKEAKP